MSFKFLKKLRIVISLIFFLLIGFIFIDFSEAFSSKLIDILLYLQVAPSILLFVNVLGIAGLGFLFIIILSLLFGRIYCSTLCPMGTMQDIIIWFSRRFKITRKYKYRKPLVALRYGLLALTIIFLLAGSALVINLLDPFSNFGKITSNIVRPVYYAGNNVLSWIFGLFGSYGVAPVEYKTFSWLSLLFALGLFIFIAWFSLKKGRLYCNSVCPVGTFLGFFSKFAIFRIFIEESKCNSCWKCGINCKAGCIESDLMTVDFSRCIGCLNCLSVCPSNGVNFKFAYNRKKEHNPERRNFLLTGLSLMGTATALGQGVELPKDSKPTEIKEDKNYPVSPPGSVSLEHFNKTCTACHLCVSACPSHVIKPSLLDYGLMGMMQPVMDYHIGYCNFDCTLCTEVCPSGALLKVSQEEKKTLQLGKVIFIEDNCIVKTEKTDCGACSEHCPTKAVDMIPYEGNLVIPEVDQEICVGCGACEFACPTKPYRAIFVDGNAIHEIAKEPVLEQVEVEETEEFPF